MVQSVKTYLGLKSFLKDRNIEERAKIYAAFNRHVDVVMIGDSLTDHADWADVFNMPAIANRGISGDTAKGILARMEGIISVGAKKAFIMVGINDLSQGESPLAILEDYANIIKTLTNHGTQVFIQSTLLCNKELGPANCEGLIDKINSLNSGLEQLAKQNKLIYINLNADLAANGELNALYTFDGIHLNATGYKVWKKSIEQYVN